MCTFVAIWGLSITMFSPTYIYFSAIILPIYIYITDLKTIQYGLLVFIQNDEVSVEGMDVHAAAYQRLSHFIPMYNHTLDIDYL